MCHVVCHGVGDFEVTKAVFEPCLRAIVLTVEEHLQSKWALLHGDFRCINQH